MCVLTTTLWRGPCCQERTACRGLLCSYPDVQRCGVICERGAPGPPLLGPLAVGPEEEEDLFAPALAHPARAVCWDRSEPARPRLWPGPLPASVCE